jgi:hypothetical protein
MWLRLDAADDQRDEPLLFSDEAIWRAIIRKARDTARNSAD